MICAFHFKKRANHDQWLAPISRVESSLDSRIIEKMKNLNNLKGYTLAQRKLAYSIRNIVVSKLNLADAQENRLYDRIMSITSPMFFIKYCKLLKSGKVAEALSRYQDENYNRKAKFMTR